MTSEMTVLLPFVFLFGIVVGSFLNVCTYRIPLGDDVVKKQSHCMSCGYRLKWYDLIPVFSWIILGGKCRKCKSRISLQYPCIELLNGILWTALFSKFGFRPVSFWYAGTVSALIVLSVIDWRTYEIPFSCNLWIGIMGIGNLVTECIDGGLLRVPEYLIGAIAVSLFLQLLVILSKGRAMGGGDVKLMAAAGLLLGWKGILWAFILGNVTGAIVHPFFIKWKNKEHVLAFGPYLSFGIWVSIMWGRELTQWYAGYLMGY